MAQKSNPEALRSRITQEQAFLYVPRKRNLGKELVNSFILESYIKKFYSRIGYDLISFQLQKHNQNQYINLRFQNSVVGGTSYPVLTSTSYSIRTNEPDSFYIQTGLDKAHRLWSKEFQILCLTLFKSLGIYPTFLKSNLFCSYLEDSNNVSGKNLSTFIEKQISLSDARRQKIHIKSYLDKMVDHFSSETSIQGIRLEVKGRLPSGGSGNKAGRSKKEISNAGNIPLQTICSHVDYSQTDLSTKLGKCSVKVWIHYN